MSREAQHVPIATLAGITNISDFLSELPLPRRKEDCISLFPNAKTNNEAWALIQKYDVQLAAQLAHVLGQVNTDHLKFKNEEDDGPTVDVKDGDPKMIALLLQQYPHLFNNQGVRNNANMQVMANGPCYNNSQTEGYLTDFSPLKTRAMRAEKYQVTPPQSYQHLKGNKRKCHGVKNEHGEHPPVNGITYNPQVDPSIVSQSPSQMGPPSQELPTATPTLANNTETLQLGAIPHLLQSNNDIVQMNAKRNLNSFQEFTNQSSPLHNIHSPVNNSALLQNTTLDSRSPQSDVISDKSDHNPEEFHTKVDGHQRHSHSKKHKKSKKHRLKEHTNRQENIDYQQNYNEHLEFKSASPRSNSVEMSGTPLVPKIILARTKLPSSDCSSFIVKEAGFEDEKGLKRRRSSSDEITMNDGKRKKLILIPRDGNDYRQLTSYKRFTDGLESMFDFDDQCEFNSSMQNDSQEIDAELLLTRNAVSEMCTETAKLKSINVLCKLNEDDLLRLIVIMKRHVKDGINLQLTTCQDYDDEEEKLWKGLFMDRILRAFDASTLVLHIMTASHMPKKVYIEEIIELIVSLLRYHLQNNIFPEYDPIYKIEPDSKDISIITTKTKRARSVNKEKIFVDLYNKICESVSLLGDLMDIERLTDTIVLQVSSLGTSPFFVENVSELQHNALKLVRTTFRKYIKHRELILEEIFASLARLPSSKRNLRSYCVRGDENIQMVTALVLQLIQCSVKIEKKIEVQEDMESPEIVKMDRELEIVGSYENALRTAQNFLSMFLNKCNYAGRDEEDYRPLFENFLQDLLITLNKNDWPAAEVLLNLLGRLLVMAFSNRSNEMGLRVASLDFLGVVAAHLRRSSISGREQDREDLLEILSEVLETEVDELEESVDLSEPDSETEKILQKYMLKYFHYHGKSDPALWFAWQFYLCQWIRDNQCELEKSYKATVPNGDENDVHSIHLEHGECISVPILEAKKEFLYSLIDDDSNLLKISNSFLDYNKANLVTKFLSSKRTFLKSFDVYLQQILRVLNETAVAVRTKAMKALSAIVAVDPSILAREDMQKGVHGRFMDQSTSVREAAVELVGRFILIKPDLTHQYYEMIMERILDTGVSVRKRVIKILKDICISQPDFPKNTEICVKMILRINDADGIKELVTKVFQQMWFVPLERNKSQDDILLKRVTHIADVVTAFGQSGCEWLQQLLESLIKGDDDSDSLSPGGKQVIEACSQIADCLVDRLLTLEEKAVVESDGRTSNSHRLIGCLTTLYLMSKVHPALLIKHATTLQPYLSTKCNTQGDHLILHYVARILELVIPLIEHPGETFLASVEEDLMKLIIKQGQTVVQSCIACLAAIINKVTHNNKLVKDCFQRYFGFLIKSRNESMKTDGATQQKLNGPLLQRSLFTLGLFCKHFDFEDEIKTQNNQESLSRQVYTIYIDFAKSDNEEISQKAIVGLGFLCLRYPKLLLDDGARDLYQNILSPARASVKLKLQILKNLQQHLVEEESRSDSSDSKWKQISDKENLKDLGDTHTGTTSEIMQMFLKRVLEAFLHHQSAVRLSALTVVNMILRQGLVHPVQCVSYLIAIGSDNEQGVRTKAAQRLEEIDTKYPGFVQMKALAGVKMSFDVQKKLCQEGTVIRGFRDGSYSVLNHLYLILRTSRQHRRSFLLSLLRMLDDEKHCNLDLALYLVDNIAFFPYSTLAEPLFIIHNIDTKLSFFGINVLQSFKQKLKQVRNENEATGDEDLEDNPDRLIERLPDNLSCLEDCWKLWQNCMLLLYLRQHLKEVYGLTDSKCRKYSPSEPNKSYDKGISRKTGVMFEPRQSLDCLEAACMLPSRQELVERFLEFKAMIMNLDKNEDESDHDSNGRESPPTENGAENVQDERKERKIKKTPGKKTQGSKGKTKPKPKKKKRKVNYDVEISDDDVDFEDTSYAPH